MLNELKLMSVNVEKLRLVRFQDEHASAFRELNLHWIEEYFAVEELDRVQLNHPYQSFVEPGGAILMAELDGSVVGCCGLLKHDEQVFEVSKMAVAPQLRGSGIGKIMLREVIAIARLMGAKRLEILSNTVLDAAIHLYKSVGFQEVPFESDAYARGNIALALTLSEADPDPSSRKRA